MPYIQQETRSALDPAIDALLEALAKVRAQLNPNDFKGVLNYTLTRIVAGAFPNVRYSNIADVIGALECVKLEFYDRIARPYEDKKRSQEGDVKEYEQALSR